MIMKKLIAFVLAIGLAGVLGCETKSGSAPSTDPNKPRKIAITAMDSHSVTQDKTVEFMVDVTRTENSEPVTIEVKDLPKGVTLETKDLTVASDKSRITLTLKAAPDAPEVTDHVFHIVGKTKDITTDAKPIKLTVKKK
jgi:hypothetical protein